MFNRFRELVRLQKTIKVMNAGFEPAISCELCYFALGGRNNVRQAP
jgi:hypothetical protein